MIVYLKTKKEIEGFKRAGEMAGLILHELLQAIEPEITTLDLDKMARHKCEEYKVEPTFLGYEGFPWAICASNNEVVVHGCPNNEKLKEGDVLSIDFGATLDGFIGDTAETIIVGEKNDPNSELLVNECRFALSKAIEKAVIGNKLNDISESIFNGTRDFNVITNYGGHGLDRYNMHATPFVPNKPDSNGNFSLKVGMILALEPMYTMGDSNTSVADDNWSVIVGGKSAHCEHTILITENGPLVLTDRSKYE
jgi:methionyl aminopeptidase